MYNSNYAILKIVDTYNYNKAHKWQWYFTERIRARSKQCPVFFFWRCFKGILCLVKFTSSPLLCLGLRGCACPFQMDILCLCFQPFSFQCIRESGLKYYLLVNQGHIWTYRMQLFLEDISYLCFKNHLPDFALKYNPIMYPNVYTTCFQECPFIISLPPMHKPTKCLIKLSG